jgi:hypothetical protein
MWLLQVGCYYISCLQYDTARRFLARATTLDEGFAPAWIAYGHVFSALDERDQASCCGVCALWDEGVGVGAGAVACQV